MAHREIVYATAAFAALALAGGASATEWPAYAPRCATPELELDQTLQHPLCGGQGAELGPTSAIITAYSRTFDVDTTGSIGKAMPQRGLSDPRSPLK